MIPRTLVIGLGGTGQLALVKLKEMLLGSASSLPSHIRLLGVDTVPPVATSAGGLEEKECIRLRVREPQRSLRLAHNAHFHDWLPSQIPVQALVNGAAQVRAIGRLALHDQVERFLRLLGECLDDLTDRRHLAEGGNANRVDDQGVIEVYILASLCGGTGSGILLDTACLVREALRDAPTVRVFGILLLPGAFRARAATERVLSNAYACLKELDYVANPREPVHIEFPGGRRITLAHSPFDLIWFIDSVGERYDSTAQLPHLAWQMAQLPYLMSMTGIGRALRDVFENLIPQVESKPPIYGKRAAYASFGVARLEVTPQAVQEAERQLTLRTIDALLRQPRAAGTFDSVVAEVQDAVSGYAPLVNDMPLMTFPRNFDPRQVGLQELEAIVNRSLERVAERARERADLELESSVGRWRERVAMAKEEVAKTGGVSVLQAECSRFLATLQAVLVSVPESDPVSAVADQHHAAAWRTCQEGFGAFRRGRRERAVHALKEVVDRWRLPVRYRLATYDALRDIVGRLRDEVAALKDWCDRAARGLEAARARRLEQETVGDPPDNPFTIRMDLGDVMPPPDLARLWESVTDSRREAGGVGGADWLVGAPEAVYALLSRFARDELGRELRPGGAGSATRILLRRPEHFLAPLHRLSVPLWSFAMERIPSLDREGIHAIEVFGVDQEAEQAEAILGRRGVTIVPLGGAWGDAGRAHETDGGRQVVQLQMRIGLPLFALTCMDDLWRDYARQADRSGFHADRRWAHWPELVAHGFPEDLTRTFARALGLGLVSWTDEGLLFQDGGQPRILGMDASEALRAVIRDKELQDEMVRKRVARAQTGTQQHRFAEEEDRMWERLIQARVPSHDRPLVEALWRFLASALAELA